MNKTYTRMSWRGKPYICEEDDYRMIRVWGWDGRVMIGLEIPRGFDDDETVYSKLPLWLEIA